MRPPKSKRGTGRENALLRASHRRRCGLDAQRRDVKLSAEPRCTATHRSLPMRPSAGSLRNDAAEFSAPQPEPPRASKIPPRQKNTAPRPFRGQAREGVTSAAPRPHFSPTPLRGVAPESEEGGPADRTRRTAAIFPWHSQPRVEQPA